MRRSSREALQCTLVEEVVVIDDGSTDATAAIASGAGARVVAESALLPEAGPGSGKGNALWKSLVACNGDLICFLDADLRNFHGEYVSTSVRAAHDGCGHDARKSVLHTSVRGGTHRRRSRHRARRPTVALAAVPEARRHRPTTGRRVRRPPRRPRSTPVRGGLGCRDRAADRCRRPVRTRRDRPGRPRHA